MSVPLLRFSEFDNNWLTKSFGKTFTGLPNNTLSRAELSDEDGSVKNVHYGDVLIKYGAFLDTAEESIPFISSGELAEKWKNAALQSGDVIIADTAEDTTAGKCTEIGKIEGDTIVAGLHTIPVHPRFEFAAGYLGYYMNSDAFHNQLLPLMQGTKVTSISKTYLSETSLRFPADLAEQGKIAGLLRNLDCDITLQQRKCDKLIALKAACLDKMFPKNGSKVPELRFGGFSGDWEQRKLGEFVSFFSGLTYSPADIRSTGTLVLRSSNVKDGEVVDADNVYVDPAVVNSENVRDGDIIVVVRNGSRALIGKHAEIKGFMPNTVIGAFMTGIRSERPSFLNALLNTPRFEKEVAMNMGATINQITGYMFSKMEFMVPSLDEQDAIGDYFKRLDNLITLHQRKLEKLCQLKQAMLHKMFV